MPRFITLIELGSKNEKHQLSTPSVREQIRHLNRLDPDEVTYEELSALYGQMFNGVATVVGTSPGSELFFRARVNPSTRPQKVSELGPPPPERITGFQRCNGPGEPMFYTASKRRTALLEARVKKGDTVYLSQWIGKDRLPVNKILDEQDAGLASAVGKGADEIVYTYIDTIFTKRIHESFSNDYKFSAALTRHLTTGFPAGLGDKILDDGTVGLRYPSVFDRKGSYNTVFHASLPGDRIDLIHVMEAVVEEAHGMHVSVNIADNAVGFLDGNIIWLNDASRIPLLRSKDSGVIFRFDGKAWLVAVRDDPTAPADIRNLLIE